MKDSVYQEELMELYKNPKHKGVMEKPSAKSSELNPICGDEIHLQLKISDNVIEEAKFSGASCAVSTISTEKLLDFIEGKDIEEAKSLTQKDLLEILDIDVSMSRIRCATLVLTALKKALENYRKT